MPLRATPDKLHATIVRSRGPQAMLLAPGHLVPSATSTPIDLMKPFDDAV